MKDVCIDVESTGVSFFDMRDRSKEKEGDEPFYNPEDYIISIGVWCDEKKTVFLGDNSKGFELPEDIPVDKLPAGVNEALQQNEIKVLKDFLSWYNSVGDKCNIRIVGYNVKNFDVPFIFYKAVKHEIALGNYLQVIRGYQNYNNFQIADSYMSLNFRIFRNNFGLAKVLKSWGMEGKYQDFHGGQARSLSRNDLYHYNLRDVKIEMELHKKLVNLGVLINENGGYE